MNKFLAVGIAASLLSAGAGAATTPAQIDVCNTIAPHEIQNQIITIDSQSFAIGANDYISSDYDNWNVRVKNLNDQSQFYCGCFDWADGNHCEPGKRSI